jgi:hypothetical protein
LIAGNRQQQVDMVRNRERHWFSSGDRSYVCFTEIADAFPAIRLLAHISARFAWSFELVQVS